MLRGAAAAAVRVRRCTQTRYLWTSAPRFADEKPKKSAKEQHRSQSIRPDKAVLAQSQSASGSKIDESETARKARAAMAKQMRASDDWPNTADDGSDTIQPLVSPTAENLLKQRFLHAQKRAPGSSLMMGGSGTPKDMPSFFRKDSEGEKAEDTSLMGSQGSSGAQTQQLRKSAPSNAFKEDGLSSPSEANAQLAANAMVPFQPTGFDTGDLPTPPSHSAYNKYEQPFNTHVFVRRLEEGGWNNSAQAVSSQKTDGQTQETVARRHDPAEAIMDLTRALLQERGEELSTQHIDRSDLDNHLYLFSSALSELRTEVRVRARNDAAALRSLTSLLQREVDGLSQKLQAEIERLKHDIQVDMNHRKTEVKDDNNSLELEIQDLNNRFTIFLSDLKTEIEQSIKWDATRRALALVFGIVAILVSTLALADYFSRPEVVETAQKIKERKAGVTDAPRVPRQSKLLPVEHSSEGMDAPPPKSAEEWGLVPRYDSEEVRYV